MTFYIIDDAYGEGVRWFERYANQFISEQVDNQFRIDHDRKGRLCLMGKVSGHDVRVRYANLWDVFVLVKADGKWLRRHGHVSAWPLYAERMVRKLSGGET